MEGMFIANKFGCKVIAVNESDLGAVASHIQ